MRLMRRSRSSALERDRRLAARGQRSARSRSRGRRGSAWRRRTSAHADIGVPQLADRGLEADVALALVGEQRSRVRHRLHRVRVGRHACASMCATALVLADRPAPLHALVRPAGARRSGTTCRARAMVARAASRRPVLSVMSASLRPFALAPQQVLLRHAHVREPDHAVLDAADAHELEPVRHLDAGPVRLDDERARSARACRPCRACAPSPPSARRSCRS
mgnify:CR=1 FL=1